MSRVHAQPDSVIRERHCADNMTTVKADSLLNGLGIFVEECSVGTGLPHNSPFPQSFMHRELNESQCDWPCFVVEPSEIQVNRFRSLFQVHGATHNSLGRFWFTILLSNCEPSRTVPLEKCHRREQLPRHPRGEDVCVVVKLLLFWRQASH